ncbi:MAG: hypothetical protein ABIJ59_11390 [Pseudomonadota bacterium]
MIYAMTLNPALDRAITDMDYLVLSGTVPPGVSPNIYGQLILAGRNKGAFVFR